MKYICSRCSFILLFLFAAGLQLQPNPEWQIIYEGNSEVSFRGISAVNDSVCWVSGSHGTILRTLDGGKNWGQLSIEGADSLDFRDLEALSRDTAIVMSIGKGSNSRVYRTENGGHSWNMVHQNGYEQGFYDAIAFWDEKNGLLQGDPVDGRLYLLRTSDGGKTWREVPKKDRPLMREGEYAFAASGTQMIVGGNGRAWIGTGGSQARVFSSNDYGKTWQVSTTPIIQGEPSTGIFSLAAGNNNTLLAVGGDYTKPDASGNNLILSKDSGDSWQLVRAPELEYRSAIRYLYSQNIFITTGPSGSEFSVDNGESRQQIKGPGFHTLGVSDTPPNNVWAAGSGGRIAKLRIDSFNNN